MQYTKTCLATRPSRGGLTFLLAYLVTISAGGCASPTAKEQSYRPALTEPQASTPQERGTLAGDYVWAANAPTVEAAGQRWEEFLGRHDPPDGEFEDGYHQQHVEAARRELLRVYYLLGRVEDGDRLLKKLGP